MHMRGKTVCKFSVKMKIQVVSIFSKTNRLLYSTTTLESTFRGITVGLALASIYIVFYSCRSSSCLLEGFATRMVTTTNTTQHAAQEESVAEQVQARGHQGPQSCMLI